MVTNDIECWSCWRIAINLHEEEVSFDCILLPTMGLLKNYEKGPFIAGSYQGIWNSDKSSMICFHAIAVFSFNFFPYWLQHILQPNDYHHRCAFQVNRTSDDKLVEKHTYSAFYDTDLESFLKKSERTEVIVTGVMTNLCCETTARDAFIRGFRVFFSTDATATSNHDLHSSTLKNLAYGFAYLVDCKRLKSYLS